MAAQQVGDRRCRLVEVLEVVEQEEVELVVQRGLDVVADECRIAHRRQVDEALQADVRAASSAIRVFPTPPGPIRVTSRALRSSALTSSTSRRRPISGVTGAGSRARASSFGSRRRIASLEPPQFLGAARARASSSARRAVLVSGQRVGLAAGPVEREHQLAVPALAARMLARVALERGDVGRGVELVLLGRDAQRLEFGGSGVGALDRAAPQRKGGGKLAVAGHGGGTRASPARPRRRRSGSRRAR